MEKQIKEIVAVVRDRLQKADIGGHMTFSIEATGRIQDGDIDIVIKLGEWTCEVKGDKVNAVVSEYLRRKGWNEEHAGLRLSYLPAADHSDEISV